ncbi:hypothetical protein [Paracidovorax oryzae]|uniref:hypothetical protein n=1 Tax=Paracidovorax oryzae TaxID=862720 RepID=UPI0009FF90E5|nr:hypothetical protein [Paracidovorax oryzae]
MPSINSPTFTPLSPVSLPETEGGRTPAASPQREPARLVAPQGMPSPQRSAREEASPAAQSRSPSPSPQAPGAARPAEGPASGAPAGAWARTRQAISTAGRLMDARTVLMRGDDAQFIEALRGGGDPENGALQAGATLPALRQGTQALREQILEAPDVPPTLKQHFQGKIAHLESTLAALETDQPLARRTAIYLGMNTLLPALPIAIAFRGHQNQFEAELAGLYAKTALMAIGSVRSPTAANRHSVMDHFMSRHYINVMQAAIFALPTFVPQLHKLNTHPAFNVGAGMVSTAALFMGFLGKEIKEIGQRMRHGVPDPSLAAAGRELQAAQAEDAPEAAQTLTLLAQALERARSDQQALADGKSGFLAQGHELSPATSKQVTLAANAFLDIATDLERVLHPDGLPDAATPAEGAGDPDRVAKYALAAFTTAVCATTTALMYPDQIGMVDLASDAVFTMALMTANARNPNVTRTDALDEFKSFAGLSLVMIAVLTANHAGDDFIEKSTSGMLMGAAAMAVLNVTIPGPIGHAAGQGFEKLYETLRSLRPADLWSTLRNVGHNALELFQHHARGAQRTPSTVQLVEIPSSPDSAHGAVPP